MATEPASRKTINVVAGVIFRNGCLLVCQRHQNAAFPLKWEFPGGKVEDGESDADALRRELKEELDITVYDERQIFQHLHSYPAGPTVSLRFFRILAFGGEAKNLVFQRIAWVPISELPQLDFLAGDDPLIEKLLTDGAAAILG
jgi:8-oxo-dGTP diphosphatase